MSAGARFTVDVPNVHDIEGSWVEVGAFETRDEAVAWTIERFGADNDGRIGLVTELPDAGEGDA